MSGISLSSEEERLFTLIRDSLAWQKKTTTARVAGGWVRDKLLGKESADIDIALDDQSGVDFAEGVNAYLASLGQETRTIAVIQANPDQSKHLETANLRVLGFEIDCVNLRAETYAADSRIPEIRFGSPLEDAMRRDFTINSLFYNINTGEIEDFSGRGLPDMKEGVIRTPLTPYQTFMDDPLRILRAIRFACRLGYRLDNDICTCTQMPEIQHALSEKVSRERVLKEMEGMLSYTQACKPILAFSHIFKLGIFDSLFVLPPKEALSMDERYVNSPVTSEIVLRLGSKSPNCLSSVDGIVAHWKEVSMETLAWCNVLLSVRTIPLSELESESDSDEIPAVTDGRKTAMSIEDMDDAEGGIIHPQVHLIPSVVSANDRLRPMRGPSERVVYWAALTSALARLQVAEKKKKAPLTAQVLRECVKMDGGTTKDVLAMYDLAEVFREAAHGVSAESAARMHAYAYNSGSGTRGELGEEEQMWREKLGHVMHKSGKQLWRAALLYACAGDVAILSLNQNKGK
jgi:tRNA nucleotidyltransferase (CCA-adding enzyme)